MKHLQHRYAGQPTLVTHEPRFRRSPRGSVWGIDRSANSAIRITDLARRPILWTNVFFRRDRNEQPHVAARRWFRGRLRRQPHQPVRPIPEAVEVIRGAASDAVARVWNCRRNARQRIHFVRIRENPRHRRLQRGADDRSRPIRCDGSLRCAGHRYQQPNRAGNDRAIYFHLDLPHGRIDSNRSPHRCQ
jgi:hypothetical protein